LRLLKFLKSFRVRVVALEAISTSHIERQNLTMRMYVRRFTRLTNGFSKENREPRTPLAIHYMVYNFERIHQSLRIMSARKPGLPIMFGAWKKSPDR
jgi:hypothetical protein